MPTDLVHPELRAVEREIDAAYSDNPLVRLTFGEAAWYFLASCEERMIIPIVRQSQGRDEPYDAHEANALADEVVNHAKWPLRWLRKNCPAGTRVPKGYSDATYEASRQLSELSSNYLSFESAFTYATMGLVALRLEGTRIVPSGPLLTDVRFEAYDRLADLDEKGDPIELDLLDNILGDSVQVNRDRFSYALTPRTVAETLRVYNPNLRRRFRLPLEWQFTNYTFAEYATVTECLWALSAIHFVARVLAASRGCLGLGYNQALLLMTRDELTNRLRRYSGIGASSIRAIISELTYGTGQIRSPDPALQPLIQLTDSIVGWAPGLILNNASERNLIVLLNRSPDARDAYARVNQQKEHLLRLRFIRQLHGLDLRFWSGNVQVWQEGSDIDLALISDREKQCLLLELKSFVGPAEPREIRDRSEEIEKGIGQVLKRRRSEQDHRKELILALAVDENYKTDWAVVSETSIGGGWVQNPAVPVVRAGHLIRKLLEVRQLRPVCDWLNTREYLPVEGRDYERVETMVRIGRWELAWHGIRGMEGCR